MKISIDAKPLYRPDGGIPQYTRRLLRALQEIDHENEYILSGASPAGLAGPEPAGLGPLEFGDLIRQKLLPIHRFSFERIDCFHGTNYFAPLLETAPTVLTIHDLSVDLFPSHHPFPRRLRQRSLPHLCHRAKRLIAVSHNTKRDLIQLYGVDESKIDVIYLAAGDEFSPVTSEENKRQVRERYSLPENFLLFLGELESRKNLFQLISAIASLRGGSAFTPLVLGGRCGDAFKKELLAHANREGLQENRDIFFPGYIAEQDLPALYSMCKLFLYLSHYEGFGLPPMEAMACGAPVLVSDNSSLGEVYRDTGFLASLDNDDDLKKTLESILTSDALRKEYAEMGLVFARSRSWQDVAAETIASYKEATSA